jgi:hypothetical protein
LLLVNSAYDMLVGFVGGIWESNNTNVLDLST